MQRPENVKELQRFLGMVNYLGSYIPNLADETNLLRSLLKKQNIWQWTDNHEKEFNKLKNLISQSPVLVHYDVNKPIRMTTPRGLNLKSPSELLMSRKLRTRLPTHSESLKPKVIKFSEHSKNKSEIISKRETYYNKSAVAPEEFQPNDSVFFKKNPIDVSWSKVCYTFSQSATKGPELAKQLKAVISQMQGAGLIVVATVCDQGTNNVHCLKLLLQETHTAILKKGQEPRGNFFEINGHEIVPIYDPPHLIKGIRNNLLNKDLKYIENGKEKIAKWEDITYLHRENPGYRGIRLVPKLTDNHVIRNKINKMKVKFATQILSQTVGMNMGYLSDKGILPPQCKDTADILILFDKLFDSVNGSFDKRNKHGKPLLGPVTPKCPHH
ncbi:unnamed protein product [Euphydryas editha]|uniref:Transposase n=1 Tax=Euphydryas editha TaxID=104508 RepID=A0AAU9UQB1_EUPED|nr:unnamed protein product [Euphydryas editha]